jgi:dGTPase
MRMSKRAERFVTEIFRSYMEEPRQLPDYYRARMEHETQHRVVADYIAALTDRSAQMEYSRLFDPLTRP